MISTFVPANTGRRGVLIFFLKNEKYGAVQLNLTRLTQDATAANVEQASAVMVDVYIKDMVRIAMWLSLTVQNNSVI